MGKLYGQGRIRSLLMAKLVPVFLLVVVLSFISACVASSQMGSSPDSAFVVDISTDGRFAISSHRDNRIILWDIEGRGAEVISERGNIFSATFSRDSLHYAWQDGEGRVSVVDLDGDELMSVILPDAYSMGFTTSPTRVFLTDIDWSVHVHDGQRLVSPRVSDSRATLGLGKSFTVEVDYVGDRFLTAGFGGSVHEDLVLEEQTDGYSGLSSLVIWDGETGVPTHHLPGNSAKTHATFSPDGNYVVSVDENGLGFVWEAEAGVVVNRLARPGRGVWVGDDHPDPIGAPKEEVYDYEGIHLQWPDDFPEDFEVRSMLAVRFVSETEFLVLYTYSRYATLYQLGDPHARKVLDLGNRPHPSTGSYLRNASIASAPEAGILVTGQQSGNGINVYRFEEESKELERIWAPRR